MLAKKLSTIFDRGQAALAVVTAMVIVFVMLLICADVVGRVLLNRPVKATVEISSGSLLYIAFLAAPWILKGDGHITIDIVTDLLGPRARALLAILSSLIGVLVFLLLEIYGVIASWELIEKGTVVPGVVDVPKWVFVIAIPVGSFFVFLEFLRRTGRYLRIWNGLSNKAKLELRES